MRLRKKTPIEALGAALAETAPRIASRRKPDQDGLNSQQRRFAEEYLLSLNASHAAIKAGYSENGAGVQGHQLLNHPKVVTFLQQRQAELREKFNVSRERLVGACADVAFASVKDFMTINPDGSPVFNFSNMTDANWAALGEVTVEEFKDGRSDQREVRRIKVKKDSKLAAIELMAKLLGFMKEEVTVKHDHQHTILGTILMEIDAEARAAKVIEHKTDEGEDKE
jgi:phage terminase small subunit